MLPPNLDNLSPFEIAIGRKATLAPKFEYKPRILSLVPIKKPKKNYRKNWLILGKDLKISDLIEWL